MLDLSLTWPMWLSFSFQGLSFLLRGRNLLIFAGGILLLMSVLALLRHRKAAGKKGRRLFNPAPAIYLAIALWLFLMGAAGGGGWNPLGGTGPLGLLYPLLGAESADIPKSDDDAHRQREEQEIRVVNKAREGGSICIRVHSRELYFEDILCEDAEELRDLFSSAYVDGTLVRLQDDYGDNALYSAVENVLRDGGIEYQKERID